MFDQIHGKEISYNNLLDINAAVDLIDEFDDVTFAILKHNNACGLASRPVLVDAWKDALAGDPVSAFGGVLITNAVIDKETAEEVNKIFFEIIIAPDYDVDALEILGQKKNRIILVRKEGVQLPKKQYRSVLNGVLVQDRDLKTETPEDLKQVTDKAATAQEVEDMLFANKIVKNSKSNAIVLAKNKQLCASGVGQTSRVDALKHAIEKAKGFGFDLQGAVMASDAFFPFPDCVEIAGNEGITAVIQPGGSVKDELSFQYCNEHGIAMVTTGFRHFKH
jgi:phosphoribosylaminoimidazolecarboxamide formyltransferase/IMP cyclohydrolase